MSNQSSFVHYFFPLNVQVIEKNQVNVVQLTKINTKRF